MRIAAFPPDGALGVATGCPTLPIQVPLAAAAANRPRARHGFNVKLRACAAGEDVAAARIDLVVERVPTHMLDRGVRPRDGRALAVAQ